MRRYLWVLILLIVTASLFGNEWFPITAWGIRRTTATVQEVKEDWNGNSTKIWLGACSESQTHGLLVEGEVCSTVYFIPQDLKTNSSDITLTDIARAQFSTYESEWHDETPSLPGYFDSLCIGEPVDDTLASCSTAWAVDSDLHEAGYMQQGLTQDINHRQEYSTYQDEDTLVDSLRYEARFFLRMPGTRGQQAAPVCKLEVWTENSDGAPVSRLAFDILYPSDFTDPSSYEQFSLWFTRNESMETHGRMDYCIFWYGNFDLYADKVEVRDETFYNLDNGFYYNDITSIIDRWDFYPALAYYFLWDEPYQDQFMSFRFIKHFMGPSAKPPITCISHVNSDYNIYSKFIKNCYGDDPTPLLVDKYLLKPCHNTPDTIQSVFDKLCAWMDTVRVIADTTGTTPRDVWYICQAHMYIRETDWPIDTLLRDPTPLEMWALAGLGLAHGAKGISYFTYTSRYHDVSLPFDSVKFRGFVDWDDNDVDSCWKPNGKWRATRDINAVLQKTGPLLLDFEFQNAFRGNSLQNYIYYTSLDSLSEFGLFEDSNDQKYFLIVNRTDNYSPGDTIYPDTGSSHVDTTLVTLGLDAWLYSGRYYLKDCYSETLYSQDSTGGTDPTAFFNFRLHDCHFKLFQVVPSFTISGNVFEGDSTQPVTSVFDADVTIENITAGQKWTAVTEPDTAFYYLELSRLDNQVNDILRITGKKELTGGGEYDPEDYTYIITVTDRIITEDDILAGEINKNLYLNHYCINYYLDYQYFTQEQPNYSGAAVMQMWTDFKDVDPPYLQDSLQTLGLSNNTDADSLLPYIDPQGMAYTLKDIITDLPPGHTFTVGVMPGDSLGLNWAMHRICWWQYTGPGALPTGGDYESWMSVRGIHTDIRPQDGHYGGSQGDWEYDVYGFWINDPDDSPASLGANSYKTANEWTSTYYSVIIDTNNPDWDSMYITVLEPPEYDAKINIVSPKPRFNDQQRGQLRTLGVIDEIPKHLRDWIIQAAIDGVTEELIPYDENFETVFNTTIPGTPFFIKSIYGNDYFAVPFNLQSLDIVEPLPVPKTKHISETKPNSNDKSISKDISKIKPDSQTKPVLKAEPTLEAKPISDVKPISRPKPVSKSEPIPKTRYTPIQAKAATRIVVLIDAEDGSFKEASWSDNPVKYLPISRTDAQRIALEVAQEMGFEIKELYPELIHRHSTPYYPEWRVIIEEEGIAIYISQDGTVTIEDLQGGPGGTMSQGNNPTPFIYSLKPISPNPFASNAVINFSIAKPGNVSLNIYDISGRLIKTLVKEKMNAGIYSVRWDGENNNNNKVAAGIYFTRLKSDSFTSVKKVILVR